MLERDDYNTIIWTIFSVAVISSATLFYNFWTNQIFLEIDLLGTGSLFTGFMILVYSSLLIEGFGRKKNVLRGT